MDSRALTSCVLLSILVLLLLSTAVQATEYREVNTEVRAEEILSHIENGDDIYIDNCSIAGELDVSKIELKTVPNNSLDRLGLLNRITEHYGDNLGGSTINILDITYVHTRYDPPREIKSNIKIERSTFENDLDLSNSYFENNVSFKESRFRNANFIGTIYSNSANFDGANFNNTDFYGANFNNYSDFSITTFNNSASFVLVNFNGSTDFTQSKFNNSADFAQADFNGPTNFSSAEFKNSANFYGANFSNFANFYRANFTDTQFSEAIFDNFASFSGVKFKDSAYFDRVKFNNFADFSKTIFNGSANFQRANFINCSDFSRAIFVNSVDFFMVNFYESADFSGADLNDSVKFTGPKLPDKIVSDGENIHVFVKYYNDVGQYEYADSVYYNYRIKNEAQKEWYEISKWADVIIWLSCGYGVRPLNALYLGGVFIVLFSIVYAKGPAVFFYTDRYGVYSFFTYFRGPGITKKQGDSEILPPKVSFLDALYFSVNTFTTVGNSDFYPKEKFKKWATLEGLLGWTILGIFMATLTHVMIRV